MGTDAPGCYSVNLCAALLVASGPLRAKPTTVRRVCDAFDFVGWRFRTRRGALRVMPSQEAFLKFRRELWSRVEAGEDGLTEHLSEASCDPRACSRRIAH